MHILLIPHVGETFGHLADALALARAFSAGGHHVEIAANPRALSLPDAAAMRFTYHPIAWSWSHNKYSTEGGNDELEGSVIESVRGVTRVLQATKPDIVIGLPGVISTQACRSLGIHHISILHGVHLAPLLRLETPTSVESRIVAFVAEICRRHLSKEMALISRTCDLPMLNFDQFVRTEAICCPLPDLKYLEKGPLRVTGFLMASIGPAYPTEEDLGETCYVTFGSGNPCNTSRILMLAREIFPKVLTSGRADTLGKVPDGVTVRPLVSNASLAGKVAAVISHGGVGTVGAFAGSATPHLIIPTEYSQAVMGIQASRMGLARVIGLESLSERNRLGRRLPEFKDKDLLSALRDVREGKVKPAIQPTSGAEEIVEVAESQLVKS